MLGVSSIASAVNTLAKLGLSVGLRNKHFNYIVDEKPKVDWFEAISENFMGSGGCPGWVLRQIIEYYPIVRHSVSMSLGNTDALDQDYLQIIIHKIAHT